MKSLLVFIFLLMSALTYLGGRSLLASILAMLAEHAIMFKSTQGRRQEDWSGCMLAEVILVLFLFQGTIQHAALGVYFGLAYAVWKTHFVPGDHQKIMRVRITLNQLPTPLLGLIAAIHGYCCALPRVAYALEWVVNKCLEVGWFFASVVMIIVVVVLVTIAGLNLFVYVKKTTDPPPPTQTCDSEAQTAGETIPTTPAGNYEDFMSLLTRYHELVNTPTSIKKHVKQLIESLPCEDVLCACIMANVGDNKKEELLQKLADLTKQESSRHSIKSYITKSLDNNEVLRACIRMDANNKRLYEELVNIIAPQSSVISSSQAENTLRIIAILMCIEGYAPEMNPKDLKKLVARNMHPDKMYSEEKTAEKKSECVAYVHEGLTKIALALYKLV